MILHNSMQNKTRNPNVKLLALVINASSLRCADDVTTSQVPYTFFLRLLQAGTLRKLANNRFSLPLSFLLQFMGHQKETLYDH